MFILKYFNIIMTKVTLNAVEKLKLNMHKRTIIQTCKMCPYNIETTDLTFFKVTMHFQKLEKKNWT